VQWIEQSTSVGSWPNYYQASWSESSARDVRLYTGGSATRKKQGLFNLSASLTYQSVLDTNRLGDWDVLYWPSAFIPFLSPASPPVGVPSQQIALGAVGKLGSDGHRWVARSDGREIIITPKAPGTSYAGQLPSAQKYTPYISANGTDLRTTAPVFCVGQHLTFQLAFEPTLTFVDHVSHWKLPDKFVNEPWQTLYSGPEGSYPLGSVNYRVNANLLTNLATSCWYVNGPSGLVSIGTNIRFSNGQLASLAANGTFSIYRPSFSNFLATANGFTWNSPWLEGAMAFNVNLNSTNSGYFGITQLIYGTGLYYGTAGEFWLDGNSEIYGEPGSNGPKWYDPGDAATHGVSLIDGPSAPAAPCVDMNATFKDYLRFMPAGASNIFVTIATNGWFMDGSACLIGGMTRSNLPPAVAPANTDEFPQWVHHMPE